MNLITGRLLAIGVAIVLISTERLLETAGLDHAFADCAFAAFTSGVVVVAADLRT